MSEHETDRYGLPRIRCGARVSYDGGRNWRSKAKAARLAATGERRDDLARAVLESRMVIGGAK